MNKIIVSIIASSICISLMGMQQPTVPAYGNPASYVYNPSQLKQVIPTTTQYFPQSEPENHLHFPTNQVIPVTTQTATGHQPEARTTMQRENAHTDAQGQCKVRCQAGTAIACKSLCCLAIGSITAPIDIAFCGFNCATCCIADPETEDFCGCTRASLNNYKKSIKDDLRTFKTAQVME